MTKRDFLDKARSVHGYKYSYPNLPEKFLSTDTIDVEYEGVVYRQNVAKHIHKERCPERNTPTKTTEQFIQEAKAVWGEKYDYSLVEYIGALKKIKIIHDDIIYEQVAISHLRGLACEYRYDTHSFIVAAKKVHGEKYDYSLIEYIDSRKKVKIVYNGIIYEQAPQGHLNGQCPERINLARRKTTETFIEEANVVHEGKYDYTKTEYIKSQINIIITCPEHGDFKQRADSHIKQGSGCPQCSESKGEKRITKYLKSNYIVYERQKKYKDCKNIFELPFDFYVPIKNILIEFDGKQHFQAMDFFGGIEPFKKTQVNDKIKSDYCEDNYITLIRIPYYDMDKIEQILDRYFK